MKKITLILFWGIMAVACKSVDSAKMEERTLQTRKQIAGSWVFYGMIKDNQYEKVKTLYYFNYLNDSTVMIDAGGETFIWPYTVKKDTIIYFNAQSKLPQSKTVVHQTDTALVSTEVYNTTSQGQVYFFRKDGK